MMYSIQTYLEDYFHKLGLDDSDRYSVSLARLYDRERHGKSTSAFLVSMKRVRTGFYKQNENIPRSVFESRILKLLDGKFKKKVFCTSPKQSLGKFRLRASA
jgi:hypothetical protein